MADLGKRPLADVRGSEDFASYGVRERLLLRRLSARQSEHLFDRALIEDALLPYFIQEEAGRAVDSVLHAGDEALPYTIAIGFHFQFTSESIDVQLQLFGELDEMLSLQGGLIGKQEIVHLPELALRRCGLGSFRGELRVLVDSGHWVMPIHQPPICAVFFLQFLEKRGEASAGGALIIAILNQGINGAFFTPDVIPFAHGIKQFHGTVGICGHSSF